MFRHLLTNCVCVFREDDSEASGMKFVEDWIFNTIRDTQQNQNKEKPQEKLDRSQVQHKQAHVCFIH